jgi:organic hydroperoxide reductase OsmC/OhrA
MAEGEHGYTARIVWEGNTGEGTARYTGYGREYRVQIDGKPELAGSADPAFRGDASRHNPEDLFLAAISSCHMLSYLALCARGGVRVLAYEDRARGTMRFHAAGDGEFTEVTLYPEVVVDGEEQADLALRLHERAHELCFIARSCSVPIHHQPSIRAAARSAARG